ncbi:MAG: DUF4173 domain-containing protein [Acetatifactor sp.]|nr:DUF4173 domain-containing protein [Acetatifactor sp.]
MSDLNQGTWAENIGNTAPQNNTEQASAINNAAAALGTFQAAPPQNYTVVQGQVTPDTEETKRLKENYGFFGPVTFLYAVFYALCMYRNGSGVTYPFFVAGSLLLLYFSLSKLGTTLKRGSIFYMAAMLLLGISTFCTDDGRLIFFNKLGIFLLMMSLLLKQFFNTSEWKLGKYLASIGMTVVSCIGELDRPVKDGLRHRKERGISVNKKVWYALLGLIIAVPVLLAVLLLLASADVVFRQMTGNIFENIRLGNAMGVTSRIVVVYFVTYALTAFLCKRNIKEEVPDRRKGEPVLAITVTGLLTLLYLLFCIVQIVGLFLGKMQLPEGYTYAMYAREGFFQLLAVSLFNLVIVLVCMSYFKESRVLKGILTVMSLCTFVMIASSALRMVIYIRFYYLTFLRILVLWSLAVLMFLFIGVLINIFRERFPLFRYSMAVVTVFYLALSFAHPDYIIARVNVANAPHEDMSWWTEEEALKAADDFSQADMFSGRFFLAFQPYHDYSYLAGLSADAAPVLIQYLDELGYDMAAFGKDSAVAYANKISGDGVYRGKKDGFGYFWMERMQIRTESLGIRTFNVSRYWVVQGFDDLR